MTTATYGNDLAGRRGLASPQRTFEQSAALEAALFEGAPEPIIGVDGDGRTTCWNAAVRLVKSFSVRFSFFDSCDIGET